MRWNLGLTAGACILAASTGVDGVQAPAAAGKPVPAPNAQDMPATAKRAFLDRYCVTCHNTRAKTGGLALDAPDVAAIASNPALWETVVRKLRAGLMPPAGQSRPDDAASDGFVSSLERELDGHAAAHRNPGRVPALHRLSRTEYQNAVRDLLAVDLDMSTVLPPDDSSYGFDNIAGVLKISRSLLERYLSAARTVSRLAVGGTAPATVAEQYGVLPNLQQYERVDGLPFGTRGGTVVQHVFPYDGEYEIRAIIRNSKDLFGSSERFEFFIDGEQTRLFEISEDSPDAKGAVNDPLAGDAAFTVRVPVKAGSHAVGATFYGRPTALLERIREPFSNPLISNQTYIGGFGGKIPMVSKVVITGPMTIAGPGDSPSRRRIFVCRPPSPSASAGQARAAAEEPCARRILSTLARRAYRRPVTNEDVNTLLGFFRESRSGGGSFDLGIEDAIRRLLVSPDFLFRVEPVSPAPGSGQVASGTRWLTDLELASRLSFFLWSSIPDDQLLDVAARRGLRSPKMLEQQVRRMLADPKAAALTTSFATQWLELRRLELVRPGDPYVSVFDDTLREGFLKETELFVDSVIREDRSVMDLLLARYTFLNERLALHYGITGIQGSHFRRIELAEDSPRRGLLGKGSILTLTSPAIRTSPVFRGKWILTEILGTAPPDPPPNAPALDDRKTQQRVATMRERMAQHRANPVCATCHSMIDPAGFALENFDAIGKWRQVDESFNRIDASGVLPDGTKFNGVMELRAALARRPDRFAKTVVEKLMTYALGRGLEYYDMPAVRQIVRDSATKDYRFQSLLMGVINSYPFRARTDASPDEDQKK